MDVGLAAKVVIAFVAVFALIVKLLSWRPASSKSQKWKERLIGILVPTEASLLLCLFIVIWMICYRTSGATTALHQNLGMNLDTEEAEARRVVQECRLHECLGINVHPQISYDYRLEEFWLPSVMEGKSIGRVRARLQDMISHGWHHGEEARAEQFEYRYARVKGDLAAVGTRERWYLPVYDRRDQRVAGMNPNCGPYLVDYTLRKVGHKWLLATDSIPRLMTEHHSREHRPDFRGSVGHVR